MLTLACHTGPRQSAARFPITSIGSLAVCAVLSGSTPGRLPQHFSLCFGGSFMTNYPSPVSHLVENQIPLPIPIETLRPLIAAVLESTGILPGWPLGRVALQETEAARCIGVKPHVLRDARLRLRLPHGLIGRTVTYTTAQLRDALNRMSINS